MLPWVCSVIDHRRRQNVVRTSVTHSAIASCATFLFLPHFDVICDLLLNRRTATWNVFVKVNQRHRRIPPNQLTEVKEHLQELLDKGVIRPSQSNYASPVVLVRKKNGALRMFVDYRQLNAKVRRDDYPLSRVDESLDVLGGAKYFSTMLRYKNILANYRKSQY